MEMKGVCNEFLSARVPDPVAISQLRGENHRDGGEEGGEMGVRDEGKKRLKGKHRALLFIFFFYPPLHFFSFFFTPPLLVPGCQAATMLSWPFFRSIGNSVGLSHRDRSGEEEAGGGEGKEGKGGGWRGGGERGRSKASLMRTKI